MSSLILIRPCLKPHWTDAFTTLPFAYSVCKIYCRRAHPVSQHAPKQNGLTVIIIFGNTFAYSVSCQNGCCEILCILNGILRLPIMLILKLKNEKKSEQVVGPAKLLWCELD